MPVDLRGVRTVLLPGTGSDEIYLDRVFAGPLQRAGALAAPVRPDPRAVVAGYLRALEELSADDPIAVGGISLGAAVAAAWALAHPERTVAVLVALPAWSGSPGTAPAAESARHTAAELRRRGLESVSATMEASSPGWLSEELTRSWRRQWPDLPDAFEQAAGYVAPTLEQLRMLRPPMGVAGAADDPIHPVQVARDWAAAAPRAALRTVGLDEFGPDPSVLGAACLAALADAGSSGFAARTT